MVTNCFASLLQQAAEILMQVLARRDVANVPLLILANKSDKANPKP